MHHIWSEQNKPQVDELTKVSNCDIRHDSLTKWDKTETKILMFEKSF